MFTIGDDRPRGRAGEACGFVLLLFLLLVPGAFAQNLQPGDVIVRQTAAQSLTLIKPSDPLFDDAIDINYPGLSKEDDYQAMRPFLAIVRNDTGLSAVAYALTWTINYTAQSATRQAVFVNRALMNRGAMTYIPSGVVRLICPIFNLTPKEYQTYQSFDKMFPARVFPGSRGLVSVDENVDGVVYSDGTFIGEDKTRVLQRYVMAKFATRDEAVAALRLIDSPTVPPFKTVTELQQMLNEEFQWGMKAQQDTPLALYVRARGEVSRDLQETLNGRGLSGFEALLQRMVGGPGVDAKTSAFDRAYQKLSDTDPRVFGTIPYKPENP